MSQFRNIRIKGLKASMSKSGKSAKIWLANVDVLDTLKEALEKRPTWKNDFSDDEREFIITNFGISEIYDEGQMMSPNFDNTKDEELPLTEDDVPF